VSALLLGPYRTLRLRRAPQWVEVRLSRPEARNAMSFEMVGELRALFAALDSPAGRAEVQAVVLRGDGGHFCSGGDVKDMRAALSAPLPSGRAEGRAERVRADALASANRGFGELLTAARACPQALIAALEGAVMGGGFGLACVADFAVARDDVTLALPEASLGLTPAQIAPFVAQRLGLPAARRLALTGLRLDATAALRLGLVEEVCDSEEALAAALTRLLGAVSRCAPEARAHTKRLLARAVALGAEAGGDLDALLDDAALEFAAAARGGEGAQGMLAFIHKQPPPWQAAWGEGPRY